MNKFHMHGLNRFITALVLVCAMNVSTWGGVLEVGASSIPSESKTHDQDQSTTQQKIKTYNDIDHAWTYNGNWSESKVPRTVGGQIHVSNAVDDNATISISGSRFTLVYSAAPNYGALDVFVDGLKINTINQKKSRPSPQKEWVSPELGLGSHVLKFVHTSGKMVSIDALRVRAPGLAPDPVPTDDPALTEVPTLAPTEISITMVASPTSTITAETPTPTFTPEVTSSPTPSSTGTFTASPTPSPLPSATPTLASTSTPTFTPSQPPTSEPGFTPTVTPTFTSTVTPTSTSSPLPSFTPTATRTFTASPTPSPLPTFTPTVTPTYTSTVTPPSTPTLISTNIHYVSPNGNDNNPGTETQPWRTIRKAANTLSAGHTVYIRGGVYNETIFISNSGTQSQPIRFLAYPGETPVIDGNNYQLPTSYWGVLLEISGNYVQVSGIEVRYSNWMGVVLSGDHDLASNLNVHHNRETGVLVSGDYGIVENSRVWQNANRNEANSPYGGGGWATGLSAARHPNYAILRGNTIYNNWGEGLSTFEANGTIMEDNTVYDNWSANVYISDATNVLLQRNLIYIPDNSLITSGSRVGIMMGDELYNPASSNITIINNLVYGAYRNFYWWQGVQGGGMVNVLVANNTFVNSRKTSGIQIDSGPHQNVRFVNNIVQQDGSLPVTAIDPVSGIAFSNNLWSKKPSSIAAGSGDILADPQLAKTGNYTSPQWYQLQASSPARDSGVRISGLTDDFFRKPRGEFPDMGAFEN